MRAGKILACARPPPGHLAHSAAGGAPLRWLDMPEQEPAKITATLVRRLVAAQFPQWADLPVRPVDVSGWDNRTFHLGAEMTVRLPSAEGYAPQVAKEQRWLPVLAPQLPLPIPAPLALGAPAAGYPWPWSVYRWLEGESAAIGSVADRTQFAADLAGFLRALQGIGAAGGPPAGPHSFFRGAPLTVYAAETRHAIAALGDDIDAAAATASWDAALREPWRRAPVWFHGDVAAGNLLVKDGRLSAVIDFGCTGVGDPACDLDPARRRKPPRLPRGPRAGPRHLGTGPGLGTVEGSDHPEGIPGRGRPQGGRGPAGHRGGAG